MSADYRLPSAAEKQSSLRLDSYLSEVRLIKRRTQAKEACERGLVLLDGKAAKPGKEVKIGQIITINFASRTLEVEVLGIPVGNVRKAEAKDFYKTLRRGNKKRRAVLVADFGTINLMFYFLCELGLHLPASPLTWWAFLMVRRLLTNRGYISGYSPNFVWQKCFIE